MFSDAEKSAASGQTDEAVRADADAEADDLPVPSPSSPSHTIKLLLKNRSRVYIEYEVHDGDDNTDKTGDHGHDNIDKTGDHDADNNIDKTGNDDVDGNVDNTGDDPHGAMTVDVEMVFPEEADSTLGNDAEPEASERPIRKDEEEEIAKSGQKSTGVAYVSVTTISWSSG